MKRDCLVLTVLVVSCVLLLQIGCQVSAAVESETVSEPSVPKAVISPEEVEPDPNVVKSAPEIRFEEVIHDFGEIGPETKNVCEFKFRNTGESLLKITKVTKTCGCTPYTLAKKEYAPGESGVLKVKYRSGKRPGSTTKRLFVHSNDKSNPKVKLSIKAKIVKKVVFEPKRLNLLLNEENAGCPKITLHSTDNQAFAIKSFKSSENCITADVNHSVQAAEFVLEPKVDIEKLRKRLNGRIDIRLTHPECHIVTIQFNALPDFKIEPSPSLTVFNAEPRKPVTRTVWILNNYNEDFDIESASSEKGIIKVLSQEKKGDYRYKLELEITPPASEDKPRFFTDVFFVNIKGGEKLEIACRGFYTRKKKESSSR